MKKINVIWIVGILLTVVLVSAIAFIRVTYPQITPTIPTSDIIYFDCDGKAMTVTATEPDGIYDEQDVVSAVRSKCPTAEITNIMKDGNYWQEDDTGKKCFYDSNTKDCGVNNN